MQRYQLWKARDGDGWMVARLDTASGSVEFVYAGNMENCLAWLASTEHGG